MTRRALAGVAIAFGVLLCHQIGVAHEETQPWVKLSPPGGRFEILMPGPSVTGAVIELRLPTFTARLHPFTALRPPFGVMCGYADFPVPPQDSRDVFDRTRDGSISNVHGKLIVESALNLEGYPGRRFRSTAQGETFIDEEAVLVGRRLYLITIISKTEKPDKDINRVFNSFHFTAEGG